MKGRWVLFGSFGGGWLGFFVVGVTDGRESEGGEEGVEERVTAGWAARGLEFVCMCEEILV